MLCATVVSAVCCRQVVAELAAPDCSRNFSSFNATLLSQIYVDFAKAVGNHTVAMQLSTLPSWLFSDGYPISKCNDDPWQPCEAYGTTGGTLRDKSCGEVARYIARLVSWFTQGGTKDECGTWHESGHRFECEPPLPIAGIWVAFFSR